MYVPESIIIPHDVKNVEQIERLAYIIKSLSKLTLSELNHVHLDLTDKFKLEIIMKGHNFWPNHVHEALEAEREEAENWSAEKKKEHDRIYKEYRKKNMTAEEFKAHEQMIKRHKIEQGD
jgi:hypothetical protein